MLHVRNMRHCHHLCWLMLLALLLPRSGSRSLPRNKGDSRNCNSRCCNQNRQHCCCCNKKQLMPLLDAGSSMLQRQPQTLPIIRRYFRICSGVERWQFVRSVKSLLDRQWQGQHEFSLWRVSVVPYSPILGLQTQANQALVLQEQIDSAPRS